MRILVIKEFSKWAKGCDLTDDLLCDAVDEIERGLIDADLGGHLLKKRIATKGKGKSGSVRTLLTFSQGNRTIFMYGFEKSERANVTLKEKKMLQELGKFYLSLTDTELDSRIKSRVLREIKKKKGQ
jgi:hypothetical protein